MKSVSGVRGHIDEVEDLEEKKLEEIFEETSEEKIMRKRRKDPSLKSKTKKKIDNIHWN